MAIHPLRRKRLDEGRSIRELSESVGVAQSTFSNWETGQSRPQPRHIDPLAKSLGLSRSEVNDLFYSSAGSTAARS